jgi:hypothetical protein
LKKSSRIFFVIRRQRAPDNQVDARLGRLENIHLLRSRAQAIQPALMKLLALLRR